MSAAVPSTTRLTVIFLMLLTLTAVTIAISFLELGGWHTPIGLMIGAVKAALVAYFFMDIWHGDKTWPLALSAGLFWLFILMGLTMADYLTRSWLNY